MPGAELATPLKPREFAEDSNYVFAAALRRCRGLRRRTQKQNGPQVAPEAVVLEERRLQFVRFLSELALVEIVLLDLVDQARAADAELLSETRFVPAGPLETFPDHFALELLE